MSEFTSAQGIERFVKLLELAKMDIKSHQLSGVKWMLSKETDPNPFNGVRGGINADEMGLGKTIMMIGTIISNFKKRTLIVVPFALLDQWYSEIYRITGHETLVYHGIFKKNYDYEAISAAPIVLTTYGHTHKAPTNILHKVKWDRVVCDEAHHMRNPGTRGADGVKNLSASICWLLTGTPIQNSKTDLYSLLKILKIPGRFYDDEMMVKTIIQNMVLKRTKEEAGVILPKKNEILYNVEWDEEELKLAKDVHSRIKFSKLQPITVHQGYGKSRYEMILRARQVCTIPLMITQGITKALKIVDEKIDAIYPEEDVTLFWQKRELTKVAKELVAFQNGLGITSKIKAVYKELMKNKENGKKKLVFCQFRKEIDQINDLLKESGFNVARVDGRTPNDLREEYLTSKTIDVLILQIQTSCEGLNLQTFSEVYFVSPHWNPAVEDQAVARCHRIGQKNEVNVYRFEMSDFGDNTKSVDMYARDLQVLKRELYEMFENC